MTSAAMPAAARPSVATYVFSSTLEKADWNNSTVVRGDAVAEVAKLRRQEGHDLALLDCC
jgi:hypothetical protein